MFDLSRNAHWVRLGALAIGCALLGIGFYFLLPKIGMLTALLIMPVLSAAQAGWISAAVASSLMTAISFVGVGIINNVMPLALSLAALCSIPLVTELNNFIRRTLYPEAAIECFPSRYHLRDFFNDLGYAVGLREKVEPLSFSFPASSAPLTERSESLQTLRSFTPLSASPKKETHEETPDGKSTEQQAKPCTLKKGRSS